MAQLNTNDPVLDKAFMAGLVNRTNLAALMYKHLDRIAASKMLYKKLHGMERQTFNKTDITLCKKVLKEYFGCL